MSERGLERVIGVPGAVLLGLGSILGTGIFVSVGVAAGVTGPSVILAVVAAGCVATFNALASASLAANHPVSGGTYEYGYRWLTPSLGFVAGWTFLCAKSASAATAALGFAAYVLSMAGRAAWIERVILAVAAALVLTAVVAAGLRRSSRLNVIIVTITLAALAVFVASGAPRALRVEHLSPLVPGDLPAFLEASALMFVAFTGYGRIATLGEEVREPERSIPRAIILTLIASAIAYVCVSLVAVGAAGAPRLASVTTSAAAPLAVIARGFGASWISHAVAAGAITAMLGVLLNLLLGLSRVMLAMARRGDLPRWLGEVRDGSPRRAVVVTGLVIAALALVGDVKTTWSFSAFTVLVYYAITNLAALSLPREQRRVPRIVPAVGLAGCLGLAFWVELRVWLIGAGLIGAGLIGRAIARAAVKGT